MERFFNRSTPGQSTPEQPAMQSEEDLVVFAMNCNGYYQQGDIWRHHPGRLTVRINEFRGQSTSFFGPGGTAKFFSGIERSPDHILKALNQSEVRKMLRKYRQIDEAQAARLAFILGGFVRHHSYRTAPDEVVSRAAEAVKFVADMTCRANTKSGDAVASAMSMYTLSSDITVASRPLVHDLWTMSEAVDSDPFTPKTTVDLGLSQVARLRTAVRQWRGKKNHPFPDLSAQLASFNGSPTIGAEFHLPINAEQDYPDLWHRLALLNMSQYQRGSYIQMSRNDREVIEVRMNPSVYPVTIANWRHMRKILPELDKASFTLTANRPTAEEDFDWVKPEDASLIQKLHAIGLLSYASKFRNVPPITQDEVNFGAVYTGQTVRVDTEQEQGYRFTGLWQGGKGKNGQIGIYTGFGDSFPDLAYFVSMALTRPEILNTIPSHLLNIDSLYQAIATPTNQITGLFRAIQLGVHHDRELRKAFNDGTRIMEALAI